MRDIATLAHVPTLAEVERIHLTQVVEACDGDITLAARVAGIGRATLYRKVKEWGLRTSGGASRQAALLRELQELREAAQARPPVELGDPLLREAQEAWLTPR